MPRSPLMPRLGLAALLVLLGPRVASATVAELSDQLREHQGINVSVSLTTAIDKLAAEVRTLKTQADIAAEDARRRRRFLDLSCAMDILQMVNFLARSAFQINVLAKFCPRADPADFGYKTATKSCLISAASLVTSMSQIALGASLAASQCQETLNIDALCAAPIAALFTPVSQYIAASTVVSAACAKRGAEIPKEIEFDRRLQEQRNLQVSPPKWNVDPETRKWQIGECVIDATSAVMAMGQMAVGLNAATRNCPHVLGTHFQEEVSRSQCTLDAGFTFFSFSRIALFVSLAVEHCAPGDQTDALCVSACSSLTASSFAVAVNGASIYLNCQIGEEKGAIIKGTSDFRSRRLQKEKIIDDLHKAAGFSRRLNRDEMIAELAKESKFDTPEELWLSLGYNFSDPDAAWKKEDPEAEKLLQKARKMLEEMQTERQEPPEELQKSGPEGVSPSEVPEVLVDPEDDAATRSCSETGTTYNLDLPGHAVSLERGVAACQARCARTAGCASFSYLPSERHCRLHGILAEVVRDQPLWISGPAGCRDAQISKATARTLKRKLQCYHPHAVYEPRDKIAAPVAAASIDDCQRRCQRLQGCVHFIYSEQDGMCSFADKSAVKLQPVLYNVAGPRHCPDESVSLAGLAKGATAEFEEGKDLLGISEGGAWQQPAAAALGAFVGTSALLWAGLAAFRRLRRKLPEGNPEEKQPTLE